MNNEEINELTAKIESCWDENNPGDVRSFDERLKQKLTPEEYELITSLEIMGGEYSMMDGWVVFSVSVIISCCLVLCLTDFFDD